MDRHQKKLGQIIVAPTIKVQTVAASIILILIICGSILVYGLGGTQHAFVHFMYLPVILTGFFFGINYGVLQGIIVGLIVGPFMPASVEGCTLQSVESWFFRLLIFTCVGAFSGFFSTLNRRYFFLIEKQYQTDAVTNLPNYRGLIHTLTKDSENQLNVKGAIAIKLKQLPDIERAFGPEIGEKLLRQIALALQNIVKDYGVIGSLENGQFALLVTSDVKLNDIVLKCRHALANEYVMDDISVFIEVHYGLVEAISTVSLNDLLKKACNAAERSIHQNKIEAYYDPHEDNLAEHNVFIVGELKKALDNRQLQLFYQPKVCLQSDKVVSFEALARWEHPKKGIISPALFIPIAEKTLLINALTKWLIQDGLKQLASWRAKGFKGKLAINFSMHNFQDNSVIEMLLNTLKENDLPATSVEIEITESALTSNLGEVADILRYLREIGFSIAIDDFGTGLSSLNYLFELPVNILKVDRVFINAMMTNSAAEAILRSAIILGHELNLEVVAEGIETREQCDLLKQIGCDIGQGYYFSPPLSRQAATKWLSNYKN